MGFAMFAREDRARGTGSVGLQVIAEFAPGGAGRLPGSCLIPTVPRLECSRTTFENLACPLGNVGIFQPTTREHGPLVRMSIERQDQLGVAEDGDVRVVGGDDYLP